MLRQPEVLVVLVVLVVLPSEAVVMVATAEMQGHTVRRLSPQAAMAAMVAMVWAVAVAWLVSRLRQAQAR